MVRPLRRRARRWLVVAIAVIGAMVAACGSGSSSDEKRGASPAAGASETGGLSGSITVSAASSLTDVFYREAAAFQKAHPDTRVNFNFGGSPTLVTQLDQGAPADVLATADEKNMKSASDKSLVGAVNVFARNRLVIAVPTSNPGGIQAPKDLAKPGLKLVLAEEGVPVGDYARQALSKMESDGSFGAGFTGAVLKNVFSEESNVKAVVAKVQRGEADAGIVYKTDITPAVAKDVTTIDIADGFNVIASYPIAITSMAGSPGVAAAFIEFIMSAEGQKILTDNGFSGVK